MAEPYHAQRLQGGDGSHRPTLLLCPSRMARPRRDIQKANTQRGARLATASRAAPALRRCRASRAIQLHAHLSYMLVPFSRVSAFLSLVLLPDGCPVSSDALPFPTAPQRVPAQRGLQPGGLLGPNPSEGRAQGTAHCKTEGGRLQRGEEGADLHPRHLHAASFQQS